MNQFHFHQVEHSPALEAHAIERMGHTTRHLIGMPEWKITFERTSDREVGVKIHLRTRAFAFDAHATGEYLYDVVNNVCAKLERQIDQHHDRKRRGARGVSP